MFTIQEYSDSLIQMGTQHNRCFSHFSKNCPLPGPFRTDTQVSCQSQMKRLLNEVKSSRNISKAIIQMRTKFTLFIIIICGLLSGCQKSADPVLSPIDQTVQYLTGGSNKRWFLRKQFLNGVPQTLTDYQLQYWKDYTINPTDNYNSSFADRDGRMGRLRIDGFNRFREVPSNGAPVLPWDINILSATEMDAEYSINGVVTREIYNAN